MPDGIQLSADDGVEGPEVRVLDTEIVELQLRRVQVDSELRRVVMNKRQLLTDVLALFSSFRVAVMHCTMAMWMSFMDSESGW